MIIKVCGSAVNCYESLTLLDDDIVKKTTTAEMMARDSCVQKEIHPIRLHTATRSEYLSSYGTS